ncbi:MAG TPA: hypothetical protein VKH42_14995 [Vicinamibacterales bacterium]|nr:hypothetical protein [Vicinamibacterales bacterium]
MRSAGRAAVLLCALCLSGCGASSPFRQYEYEEDLYLSLDGSATLYVNASLAALNALRGASFDTKPVARFDRDAVRQYFSSPITHVTWARSSRRNNRRFAHVRIEVDDVRRLGSAAPFAWSSYAFERDGALFVYKQIVGAAAAHDSAAGWSGSEPVAFRLHLPSKITFHDNGAQLKRGNILVWEQTLADRLNGVPLAMEARMETQSILYRTLYLFGATFVAVAIGFAIVLWWIVKRAGKGGGIAPGGAQHV